MNYTIFIYIMFRLSTLRIYMDPRLEDENAIANELRILNTLKISACSLIFVSVLTSGPLLGLLPKLLENSLFSKINLIKELVAFLLYITVFGYLQYNAYKMQSLLRAYNHVQGCYGEVTIAILFFLLFIHFVKWQILEPFFILKLNNSNFTCTDIVQQIMSMLEIIDMTIWPLAYQSVFLGIIWELSRIQKEGNATESVTWHFEGDGMSSYRDMVGYRGSSITI